MIKKIKIVSGFWVPPVDPLELIQMKKGYKLAEVKVEENRLIKLYKKGLKNYWRISMKI